MGPDKAGLTEPAPHNKAGLLERSRLRPAALRWVLAGLGLVFVAWLMVWELDSSTLQARLLSTWARELRFSRAAGPAEVMQFPDAGPFDERLGYTRLPDFLARLGARDFAVTAQARQSGQLARFVEAGFFPPYHEKTQAGLSLLDCRGEPLFRALLPQTVYPTFAAVPPVVAQMLAFIENREVLATTEPKHNPALEWTRLGRAVLEHAVTLVESDHPAPGGSTLATQIEKFRHSPDGRTAAPIDKLRQVVSASVRAYIDGEQTLPARQRIVLDYLNSLPLGAQRGWGEVNGVNDGLAAWYGADPEVANRLLAQPSDLAEGLPERALALRQLLSLVIAQRRPAFYFGAGQAQLNQLTAGYLRLLGEAGIIGPALRDAALHARLRVRLLHEGAPDHADIRDRKAANLLRVQLAGLLDTPRLYELDRLDLSLTSSIDGELQRAVTDWLQRLNDPKVARQAGLIGDQLLQQGDPGRLLYSFTLVERDQGVNRVRVQTDNLQQPFDINSGAKLELGSTAKLRTLATYLELIASLHAELSPLQPQALAALEVARKDRLTRWAVDYLASARDRSLAAMLDAALERRYSAHPGEVFYTGGGAHVFENFKSEDDAKVPSVREALRDSVNLVFIRLMRDLVYHHIYRTPGSADRSSAETILTDGGHPERLVLLKRFADREGRQFMRGFYRKHQGRTLDQMFDALLQGKPRTASRLAAVYRGVAPDLPFDAFLAQVRRQLPGAAPSEAQLRLLFDRLAPGRLSLADLGYLAQVHPLDLWVAGHLREHPGASLAQVLDAGAAPREAAYSWLYRERSRSGQNSRILSILEIDAFARIHRSWQGLGYPFDSLVPSYATAIGSSGDRPAALAELMGIISSGGLRLPVQTIERLHFGADTPYETVLQPVPKTPGAQPRRVMAAEVAAALQRALAVVVEEGTARRLRGAFDERGAARLQVGGKTGTGDNRLNTYTRVGELLESRATSRTATFVFYLGERHFGTLTAFVPGTSAAELRFTSALPVQILKSMAPLLKPVLAGASCPAAAGQGPVAAQ